MRAVQDNPAPRPKVETGHRERESKGRPSLDARSLAPHRYLPKELYRPHEKSKVRRVSTVSDYYVYVYIDPRNYEEFYYGKGKGSRKDAHLGDAEDSAKTRRISEIKQEGLAPIIRVIARDITESEALLIEKTLLWKLGKLTTNIATGHFASKFRPHNTFHKELSGFDYQNGIYYYNVGEGPHRKWDDYIQFGFISAGGGKRCRDAILGFNPGDIFVAYLKKHGFVGVGRIKSRATMVRDIRIAGEPLLSLPLRCRKMDEREDDPELSEYVCLVEWIKTVPGKQAKWRSRPKLYTTTHVRASLDGQQQTVDFIEHEFKVSLRKMAI